MSVVNISAALQISSPCPDKGEFSHAGGSSVLQCLLSPVFWGWSKWTPLLAGLEDITPHLSVWEIPFQGLISGHVCILSCRVLLQERHQQHSKGIFQEGIQPGPPISTWVPPCNLSGHWCLSVFKERTWALLFYTRSGSEQERAGKDRNIIPTGRIYAIYFLISWTSVSAFPSWFWPCSQSSGSPHILYRMFKCLANIRFY